jgi:hypothetical protein
MCPGPVVSKRGPFEVVALLSAAKSGPAIPPEIGSLVTHILHSQSKETPIDRQLLAPGATAEFCTTFSEDCKKQAPLRKWPLRSEFVPGAPYALADGRVRIEWLRRGKLQYLSFITFVGAKVVDISTVPAQIPRIVSD